MSGSVGDAAGPWAALADGSRSPPLGLVTVTTVRGDVALVLVVAAHPAPPPALVGRGRDAGAPVPPARAPPRPPPRPPRRRGAARREGDGGLPRRRPAPYPLA